MEASRVCCFVSVWRGCDVWWAASRVVRRGLEVIADLAGEGQSVLGAKGGRGGWGNAHYATPTNRAPRIAQKGQPGEEAWVSLELKLLADVGIVGYPNVGKSTLLSWVSQARPKIADYPFTTVEPFLGVVEVGFHDFVVADIPGLIEGAHRGVGLGHDFLRHIERTRLLIHLIDGTSEDPRADLENVREELRLFNPSLAEKTEIVAVNKVDLPEVRSRAAELKGELGDEAFIISAATGEGVDEVMAEAARRLAEVGEAAQPAEDEFAVFHPRPVDRQGRPRRKQP